MSRESLTRSQSITILRALGWDAEDCDGWSDEGIAIEAEDHARAWGWRRGHRQRIAALDHSSPKFREDARAVFGERWSNHLPTDEQLASMEGGA